MKSATLVGLVVAVVCFLVRCADGQGPSPAPQVLVRIKMIEASRTKLERLGLDLAEVRGGRVNRVNSDQGLAGLILTDRKPGDTPEQEKEALATAARSMARFRVVEKQDKFLAALKALEKDGLVRVLAEPRLVTVSGRPAFLQVGAEIPMGSQGEDRSREVERKFAGTRMDLVPMVLDGGRIRLEVRLCVTEVDPAHTALAAGRQNPALRTWAVDTAVEMQSGQTAVLGGLVQKRLVTKTVTAAAPAGQNHDGSGAPPTQEVTEPEEFESLVLIAPEIVEPKDGVLTATPGTSRR